MQRTDTTTNEIEMRQQKVDASDGVKQWTLRWQSEDVYGMADSSYRQAELPQTNEDNNSRHMM